VANQLFDMAFSLESILDFLAGKALDFRAALDSEPAKVKEILACQIYQLVLTPRETAEVPAFGWSICSVLGDSAAV
jgi:hypothetical protein